ncbi:hypothetical protein ACQP1S_31665 [Micromonospora matsumotoense]|uniref:hypothetical protein n=1 Tax=Micromonospora matsumotoense TaxID=121616 RepID=UPI003D8F5178
MPVGPVTASALLGVLAGLAAPRVARAFPPRTPPVGASAPAPVGVAAPARVGVAVVGAVVCGGLAAARGRSRRCRRSCWWRPWG